jgi:hypothetical protein
VNATDRTLADLYPLGQIVDEGDTILQTRRLIKGRRFTTVFHWGAPRDTVAADRVPNSTPPSPTPERKPDHIMDLHADKKVDFSLTTGDEFGNPVPFNGTVAYAVDNPALVNLTDNGDASGTLAAVGGLGNLGTAILTATITPTGGTPFDRTEAINVIAGDAETFTFAFGPETEVTPDTP